tara:strand:- start:750 stop:1016 length:267 start_codon:yes stop_codon:yes gene_type:complete
MTKFYIKYECNINNQKKYDTTTNIMKSLYDETLIVNEWYISDNCGILIIETSNFFNTKIKLNKYFNIIEYKEIYNIDNWLNDFENKIN